MLNFLASESIFDPPRHAPLFLTLLSRKKHINYMGRISEYDRKRNKRLLIAFPLSIILLFIIWISVDRAKLIDKIFYVGYEGPPNFVPEITIIDEKSIESDVTRQERHAIIAQNVVLDSDRSDRSKNPNDVTSEDTKRELEDPSFGDKAGENLYRSYKSHADVPYRQNYVLLKMVKPEYPKDALALGIEGYVLVEAYITSDGKVAEAWIQSAYGPKSFEVESLKAIKQFLFKPATQNGEPIPFWVSFLIRFEFSATDHS
jgi:TonB family protein